MSTSPAKQFRSIALLPGNVTLTIPTLILVLGRGPNTGWGLPTPLAVVVTLVGAASIGLGLYMLATTIGYFMRVGLGTLAPWDPPERLVVEGPYRHVRNPMISGMLFILLGEALASGSPGIVSWWALLSGVNALYIPLSEEPGLLKRFGHPYQAYRDNVPRWIPRRRPWRPPDDPSS